MTASSMMGIVEGILMKPFAIINEVATGLLRVKGSGRSLLLRASLQFESGANLSCSFERGSHLRLTGIVSRGKENTSMLDIDVMSAADVCLQEAVESPNSTPATTPKEAIALDRSRLFQGPSTSNAEPLSTPTSSKSRHTGNSPVKQETSPGVSSLVRDAIFEEAERNGQRRSTVLRELYHDTNKKQRVLQIDSDSD
ncbi:hypothetical protein AAVH_18092 [Aphelenchoides avenae]|nr:hypothetical protein AAVH_18092 [Aphelenchus avenae]